MIIFNNVFIKSIQNYVENPLPLYSCQFTTDIYDKNTDKMNLFPLGKNFTCNLCLN